MKKILMLSLLFSSLAMASPYKCAGNAINDTKNVEKKMDKMNEHAQAASLLMDKGEAIKAGEYAKEAQTIIKHIAKSHRSELNSEDMTKMNEVNGQLEDILVMIEFIKENMN